MIRRSPSEVYIRYLLVHPNRYTNEQVKETLMFAKLDYLGSWYLDRLRASMQVPVPFHPWDVRHRESQRFLLGNGLHDLFFPDGAVRDAFKLLRVPRCKQWVEAMIGANVPFWEISSQLLRAMGYSCSEETIKRYSDIFYNPNLLDVDEMRALVELRAELLAGHPDPEIRAQAKAVKKASYKSPMRTVANMPISSLTTFSAMISMGLMPNKLDVPKVLSIALRGAAVRATEAAYEREPGDAQRFSFWATGIHNLLEALKDNVNVEEQLREQLSNLQVKYDRLDMPTVQEITGGRVTQNLEPELRRDEPIPVADDDLGGEGDEPPEE
jgi:hypothetical protein